MYRTQGLVITLVALISAIPLASPGESASENLDQKVSSVVDCGWETPHPRCQPETSITPLPPSPVISTSPSIVPLPATVSFTGPPPVAGQPCPSFLHDSWVTTGPDGNSYPTWHPAIDPRYGCFYGHEHG